MTWTGNRIEALRRLWQEGLSTAQIGREIGVSKNAVVGKVHRLKLPSRPSPIKSPGTAGNGRGSKVRRFPGRACEWPIGDPGEPDFRFCGQKALVAGPYCAEHESRAHVAHVARRPAAGQSAA